MLACVGLAFGSGALHAEEPMTTAEVVQELVELTAKITPFTVSHDAQNKWLIFREVLETHPPVANPRIGELRVRLDRIDRTRVNYRLLEPGLVPIILKGKLVAGRANFYCREGEKCIARDLHDNGVPASFVDEAEQTFGIDIFGDVPIGLIRRFADLIGHLSVVSTPK